MLSSVFGIGQAHLKVFVTFLSPRQKSLMNARRAIFSPLAVLTLRLLKVATVQKLFSHSLRPMFVLTHVLFLEPPVKLAVAVAMCLVSTPQWVTATM